MGRRIFRGFRALLIGPPGSGKGTVSGNIAEMYGVKHISTGDILRQHVLHQTQLGRSAKSYLDNGLLVPDELLTEIVNKEIYKSRNHNFLLDGYPRSLQQALNLLQKTKLDFVIHIDIPYASILRRVQQRLVHLPSGRVYSIEGPNSPKVPFRDDYTNEILTRRSDDKPSVMYQRLRHYEQLMKPVLDMYCGKNLAVRFLLRKHEDLWPAVRRYLKARWRTPAT